MAFTKSKGFYRATAASGAMSETITLPARSTPIYLHSIKLHLGAASAAENFVVAYDAVAGAAYDFAFITAAMNGLTDYAYNPNNPFAIYPSDILKFTYTNTNDGSWALEVHID